jgi:glucose-6-phosphate isomerase
MLVTSFAELTRTSNQLPEYSVSETELESFLPKYNTYKDLLLSRNQGFLDLPKDFQNLQKIKDYTSKVNGKYKYFVVCGIGGSMLGPQTIVEAIKPEVVGQSVFFIDNIDPSLIHQIFHQIDLSKTLFLIQTKSGQTPETIAHFSFVADRLEQSNLNLKDHVAVVTDPTNGYLRGIAKAHDLPSFEIPANVGGRFSVLSSIGLLVSELVNIDTTELLSGAENSLLQNLDDKGEKDAFKLSLSQYLLSIKGLNINVLMPYSSRLKRLSEWYKQLLSESIGKKNNLNGQIVNTGLTPVSAVGATDQHSQLQLFEEGPFDKLVVFIQVKQSDHNYLIPRVTADGGRFEFLEGKTFQDLLEAEFKATRESLTQAGKANISLEIDTVNEYNLGSLFMFLQLSVGFLGELFEIDTFNQPGVEKSKVLTKKFLHD